MDQGIAPTYEYAVVPELDRGEVLVVYSTDQELLPWLRAELEKLFGLFYIDELQDPAGDTFFMQIEIDQRVTRGSRIGGLSWWLHARLCERGWEPLGNREFRLRK